MTSPRPTHHPLSLSLSCLFYFMASGSWLVVSHNENSVPMRDVTMCDASPPLRSIVSHERIDDINILQATMEGMKACIVSLKGE